MPFKAATVASLKRQILGGSFLIPSYVSDEARDLIAQLMAQVRTIQKFRTNYKTSTHGQYSIVSCCMTIKIKSLHLLHKYIKLVI